MATLAVSAVSTKVGSSVGLFTNTAKQLGVSDYIFGPEENADKLSGRVSDLTIQTSTYNEVIPIVYGTVRIAGNIIWATDIREEVKAETSSTRVGGKGGSTVSQTTYYYSYYATLAIGICEGEIDDLSAIWADEKNVRLSKLTYTLYKGTETQTADSTIQSYEGVDATPAYKGLVYIVIEDFPLAEYGNRIPNFTFEITRKARRSEAETLENKIKSVITIPGSGEFVYDTIIQSKVVGDVVDGIYVYNGGKEKINQNNNSGVSDSVDSLNQLNDTLPNLEWVAPVACWFGDSTDIADCLIKPRVEYKVDATNDPILTTPDSWGVGSWTRETAPLVGDDSEGNIRYGGTVSDDSLVRYLQELKSRGYNVMFYPMIFMDVENKPWRGRLTGAYADVSDFFTQTYGYNEFVLHYANLVKNYVDAFVIGSEMIGLTSITDGNGNFPAVNALVSLAASVKTIVGSGVKVTYAADWSEYHHTDDGWYNLDPLWASSNIDFIGIDAYFPLTDESPSGVTKQKIKDGWTSGEGYDWYYTDFERTTKSDLDDEFAWKNIAWWWSHAHTNPDESQTSWTPESKKIWFTEYGFPSVDGCSNQPNVFYDPESSESALPRFSEGKVDFFAQRQALEASEEVWENSSMVERMFVWTWDMRPYPFYPHYNFIWNDSGLWKYGHWITGKLGSTLTSDVIYNLVSLTGLVISDIDTSEIYEEIQGLVINNRVSVKDVFKIIQKVNNFDCVDCDGELQFLPKAEDVAMSLTEDDICGEFEVDIINENEIPQRVDITYIDKDLNYEAGNASAERIVCDNGIKETISLPVVLSDFKARGIADKQLYLNWIERVVYKFNLSKEYLYLNSADIISVTINDIEHQIRISEISLNDDETITIYGVRYDSNIYDRVEDEQDGSYTITQEVQNSEDETNVEILDLPAVSDADLKDAKLYFAVNGKEEGWPGCALYKSKDDGVNYNYVSERLVGSNSGVTHNELGTANPDYFDYANTLTVKFDTKIEVELASVTDVELFSGSNIAVAGSEIIQFKTAVLNEDGTYTLSNLLRGQFGTDDEIDNHTIGERFVLLDAALISDKLENYEIGSTLKYKAAAFGEDLADVDTDSVTPTAKNLIPLAPVHVSGERDGSGNLTISWKRRARGYSGWRDYVDVPLIEAYEMYEVEILNGSNEVVRTIDSLTSATCSYTAAQQTTDFGSAQSTVTVKIYQISDVIGRGAGASEMI